ncbi:MAG TPA: hypothetical protein VE178_05265 [Silvibacterium sp.]|nr:hypothetical protein [Silvibacterium sp.]
MRKLALLVLAAGLLCTWPLFSAAQDNGTWRAISSTANAITGDIIISDDKLSIDYAAFTIAQIRKLEPSEAAAAFNADGGARGSGNLYRLSVPAAKRFLHHNTLCGAEETQWMATYVAGHDLQVAFFSGTKMPVLTSEALANSADLCGTFTYVR